MTKERDFRNVGKNFLKPGRLDPEQKVLVEGAGPMQMRSLLGSQEPEPNHLLGCSQGWKSRAWSGGSEQMNQIN